MNPSQNVMAELVSRAQFKHGVPTENRVPDWLAQRRDCLQEQSTTNPKREGDPAHTVYATHGAAAHTKVLTHQTKCLVLNGPQNQGNILTEANK